MMKKLIIILFCVLLLILTWFGWYSRSNQQRSENTIIFGTAAGYAPFVSINEKGEYEGFDIDVIYEIANALNSKVEIKDLGSMTSLFIALEKGIIDAIVWGLSITKDRQKKVAMIQYQGETVKAYPLIFWGKIPDNIRSMNDMAGMTVCVESHSSQEAILNKYPFVIKKQIEKIDDALLNIQFGKADAALVEPAIAKKFKAKFPEIILLNVPLEEEDQVHGIGIAVMPDNNEMIDKMQKAVTALKRQGAIKKLEKQWGIS